MVKLNPHLQPWDQLVMQPLHTLVFPVEEGTPVAMMEPRPLADSAAGWLGRMRHSH